MARKKAAAGSPDLPPTGTQAEMPAEPAPAANGTPPEKRRPVVSFRCASGKDTYLEVSVWVNLVTFPDGTSGPQHVTSLARSYRTPEEWKTNHSYRQHDLPVLRFLLEKAHGWILQQRTVEDVPF